jgi:hypothetical protein
VTHRFDPGEQPYKEHLQLLGWRVLEHFLLDVDPAFYRREEVNLA